MIEVFAAGADGRASYRVPAVLVAADGSLLAFAEGRLQSTADHGNIDVVLRRSVDGGHTWSPIEVVCAGRAPRGATRPRCSTGAVERWSS
jgi:sialidase-1